MENYVRDSDRNPYAAISNFVRGTAVQNVVSYVPPSGRKTKRTAISHRRPFTAAARSARSPSPRPRSFLLCFFPRTLPRKMDSDDAASSHEMMSTLKSELAALQFKRDRLMSEVSVCRPRSVVPGASSPCRRPFTAARHQRAIAVPGPEDGRARGRDGNVEGTASPAKLDNRQPEESNKSTVFAGIRVGGPWWSG